MCYTSSMNRDSLKQKITDIRAEGFRNHIVQGIVIGLCGAVLARVLAFTAHTYELTPYYTAILFETVFPAILVFVQQRMNGTTAYRAITVAAIASFVGFAATSATGIVSH